MIREAINEDYNILSLFYRDFDENGVELFQHDPFSHVFVYERDNKIIGFISFSIIYDRAEINYIYVTENKRKEGVASALMDFCINEVIKYGCINLTLEVSSENIAGIKLYEKYGFSQAAIRPHYYNGIDGFLMIRELIK